jgi:hypothetical protein
MPRFTTRVELHGASGSDYTELHHNMQEAGFYRAIVGDDGQKYGMPTAEYDSEMNLTVEQVRNLAMSVAAKAGKQY